MGLSSLTKMSSSNTPIHLNVIYIIVVGRYSEIGCLTHLEVFTQQNISVKTSSNNNSSKSSNYIPKSNYYDKFSKQQNNKRVIPLSCYLVLLIQFKKYEILSDIVTENNQNVYG